MPRPVLGRRLGEGCAQQGAFSAQRPQKREFGVDGGHGAAITEPHSRLSDCQPDVFRPHP
jgi:hypothetical protein